MKGRAAEGYAYVMRDAAERMDRQKERGDRAAVTAYDVWLAQLPGIGSGVIMRIRKELGGDPDFARQIYHMPEETRCRLLENVSGQMRRGNGLSPGEMNERMRDPGGDGPKRSVRELSQKGIRFAAYDDVEYPEKLRHMDSPPSGLYYRGHLPSSGRASAGIVGARMASAYGREQARRFSSALAKEGVQVISGMARGIDGIAGRGALDVDGESFAVLGCGVDVCYPSENRDLYGALCERGGVLSEYPPGTQPQRRLFPARNRIISALSDVLLVIEAGERSGTMITVDRALECGIDVFALPGRVSDRNSRGCNNLIRQGAGIATCPEDILAALFGESAEERHMRAVQMSFGFGTSGTGMSGPEGGKKRGDGEGGQERTVLAALPEMERAVWKALDASTPHTIDEILPQVRGAMKRAVSFQEVLRAMTLLILRERAAEIRVGNYIAT